MNTFRFERIETKCLPKIAHREPPLSEDSRHLLGSIEAKNVVLIGNQENGRITIERTPRAHNQP
jgi:hypothetical protein